MAAARPARRATPSATPLTDAYIASGDWNPLWDAVRELDPEFVEAYLAFRSIPHRKGPLPPKFKELVLVAVNVATTHLYAPGARRHMRNALRLGATPEEILEVIQLTTLLGIHAVNFGVPMLREELQRAAAERDAAATAAPRASKPRASKAGAAKTGAAKAGAAKTGAAKTGAAKTGAAKTGAAKTGAAKAATPKPSTPKPAARKPAARRPDASAPRASTRRASGRGAR